MNTKKQAVIKGDNSHWFHYSRDGIQLEVKEGKILLSYPSHGQEIHRKFYLKGPEIGSAEFFEKDCGLHVRYYKDINTWALVHYYPHHLRSSNQDEWFEDTIYIPAVGKPFVKVGYFPDEPGKLHPRFVEMGIGLLVFAEIVWVTALLWASSAQEARTQDLIWSLTGLLALLLATGGLLFFGRKKKRSA